MVCHGITLTPSFTLPVFVSVCVYGFVFIFNKIKCCHQKSLCRMRSNSNYNWKLHSTDYKLYETNKSKQTSYTGIAVRLLRIHPYMCICMYSCVALLCLPTEHENCLKHERWHTHAHTKRERERDRHSRAHNIKYIF